MRLCLSVIVICKINHSQWLCDTVYGILWSTGLVICKIAHDRLCIAFRHVGIRKIKYIQQFMTQSPPDQTMRRHISACKQKHMSNELNSCIPTYYIHPLTTDCCSMLILAYDISNIINQCATVADAGVIVFSKLSIEVGTLSSSNEITFISIPQKPTVISQHWFG